MEEDRIMLILLLGTLGLAIGRSESYDSVDEDRMMFILFLGIFGFAIGKSES